MNSPGRRFSPQAKVFLLAASRIICLSAESAEILAALEEAGRICGITGFAPRIPELAGKPRVSGFSSAKLERILALEPDLVLAYSDVQADIAATLARAGCNVLVTTQHTVAQILDTILLLGRIVQAEEKAAKLVDELRARLGKIRVLGESLPARPRVWFEEWMDPLISGAGWVQDLIEIAGGQILFPEIRSAWRAADRVVDAAEVARRNPELILASWCGRRANLNAIRMRPGWKDTAAVRSEQIHEIRSHLILAPGITALREGLETVHALVAASAGRAGPEVG